MLIAGQELRHEEDDKVAHFVAGCKGLRQYNSWVSIAAKDRQTFYAQETDVDKQFVHAIVDVFDDAFDEILATAQFAEMIECSENPKFFHQSENTRVSKMIVSN